MFSFLSLSPRSGSRSKEEEGYQPLPLSSSSSSTPSSSPPPASRRQRRRPRIPLPFPLVSALATALAAVAGFYTGTTYNASLSPQRFTSSSSSSLSSSYSSLTQPIELPTTRRTFHYDPTFGSFPTVSASALNTTTSSSDSDSHPHSHSHPPSSWDVLFPSQGGFFRHPTLSPHSRSTFAVFHQLHCLDAIRHSYALLLSLSNPLDLDSLPLHLSPLHMRHCIDLLRQSLMCRPDLTVEKVDLGVGGVTGFGSERVCVRWEAEVGEEGAGGREPKGGEDKVGGWDPEGEGIEESKGAGTEVEPEGLKGWVERWEGWGR